MPSTVLGKRTRGRAAIENSIQETSRTTRAKRRGTQFVILDESENINPFVSRSSKRAIHNGGAMEVEDLAMESVDTPRKKGRTAAGTVPAKHGVPESRVALSPKKITSHFKATKAAAVVSVKEASFDEPHTPRHRDSLAKKAPVTPKHRVLVPGKPLTPRTPHTPSTPRANQPTVYNLARQIFAKGNLPSSLYGRERERADLERYIQPRIESQSSGCIYVSGPPGTGKSAFVNDITTKLSGELSVSFSYINCMSVRSVDDIHRKLIGDFIGDDSKISAKPNGTLKTLFYGGKTPYLITLDEIDHLLDLDINLLYTLFEWALDPKSTLILVGIANALDFTDRFLPRLKSRGLKPDLLPFLPYSAAQLASIIISKLRSLLPETAADKNYVPFIHPTAVQFLAKKVSSQSGDLRKSFDICRRAIDLIETETRENAVKKASEVTPSPTPSPCKTPGVGVLVENMNLSSPPVAVTPSKSSRSKKLIDPARKAAEAASLATLTIDTAPRATIAHMARITATIFSNGTTQRLQSLNLQQKAVLCSLSALEARKREIATDPYYSSNNNPLALATPKKDVGAAPTIRELYEAYTSLCRRENLLHPLTSSEFRDIVGSLETLGMVSPVEGKAGSLALGGATPSKRGRAAFATSIEDRRVASSVGKKELEQAIEAMKVGKSVLWGLLRGDGL